VGYLIVEHTDCAADEHPEVRIEEAATGGQPEEAILEGPVAGEELEAGSEVQDRAKQGMNFHLPRAPIYFSRIGFAPMATLPPCKFVDRSLANVWNRE
jgi:hypothetical protein